MVADKSCGLLLGFLECLLITPHETVRAVGHVKNVIINEDHNGVRLHPARHLGVGEYFPRNLTLDFPQYRVKGRE